MVEPPSAPVALLFHEGRPSGAPLALARALDGLTAQGWTFAAYVDRPGPLADLLEEKGIAVAGRARHVGFSRRWLRHPPGPAVKLRSMPAWFGGLGAWLRRTRPALVHANGLYALPDALLARATGVPTFLWVHEMLPEGRKGAVARRVCAPLHVATVSEASARRWAGGGPLPLVVRPGVPFPAGPAPGHAGPPVVGSIGLLCERKGTDLLVAAAARVLAERPDVAFRLVGPLDDGPAEAWSRARAAEAEALGARHVTGADGLAELQGFDLLVHPARADPYPLVVMEAMASGVPVVATAVDGLVEQVVPGTGTLVPPEDPAALAAAVLELLRDEPRRARAGAAAREHALRTFGLERQVEALAAAWVGAILR